MEGDQRPCCLHDRLVVPLRLFICQRPRNCNIVLLTKCFAGTWGNMVTEKFIILWYQNNLRLPGLFSVSWFPTKPDVTFFSFVWHLKELPLKIGVGAIDQLLRCYQNDQDMSTQVHIRRKLHSLWNGTVRKARWPQEMEWEEEKSCWFEQNGVGRRGVFSW